MRDFFESNACKHGVSCIAPLLALGIGAGASALGGVISGAGASKAAKKAERKAHEQSSRNVRNSFALQEAQQALADRASRPRSALTSTGTGTAQGGFTFGDEFLTEGQARERGLIRDETKQRRIAQPGDDTFMDFQEEFIDPRLTATSRARLSPELEAIRTQALGFQANAGRFLQGGFRGIDEGLAQRELDLMSQLAAPREAEAREQLFGQQVRAGILQSTTGANAFRGAEEAFGRAGLERELAARGIARGERDSEFAANQDLFSLGQRTSESMSGMEQQLLNQNMLQATAVRGGPIAALPNITNFQAPVGAPQANAQTNLGGALGAFGSVFSSMGGGAGGGLGGLFSGIGGAGGAGKGQGGFSPRGLSPQSKSENLFGAFVRS